MREGADFHLQILTIIRGTFFRLVHYGDNRTVTHIAPNVTSEAYRRLPTHIPLSELPKLSQCPSLGTGCFASGYDRRACLGC